jgi:hypothetical protein
MDAYLRDVGIEMQTYAVNGVPVIPRDGKDSYRAVVRDMLVAYATGSHIKPVWPWD